MQRVPLKLAHPMQDANNLVQHHFQDGMLNGSTAESQQLWAVIGLM